jgi:hypothetical protein
MNRFRGIPAAGRQFTALNRALEHAFEIMDHCWISNSTVAEVVDFASPYTIATVQVPKPPDGYSILLEGWANFEWSNATALDCYVNIEHGTKVLARSYVKTEATALSYSMASKAVLATDADTTVRFVMRHNAARTSVTANTRGLAARFIVER